MTLAADPKAPLRAEAELLGQSLPALLAEAEMLAQTVMLGEHGRKRAGQGDEFWQYRAAHAGDSARAIDWRRSARADTPFVREREWQAAQSVTLWADPSRSMGFSGDAARPTKGGRAKVLALALGILLLKGGERVLKERFGVDAAVCSGDHACMRVSGCPSLTLAPSGDALKPDPVAHVDEACVACGHCGEVADSAVLCPSFYKVERVHNASGGDRWINGLRHKVLGWWHRRTHAARAERALFPLENLS